MSQFTNAIFLQKYTFESTKDFTPIFWLASRPLMPVTRADTQIQSVAQLIAKSKSQPNTINYASGGSGA